MGLMLSNPLLRVNIDVHVERTPSRMISIGGAPGTDSVPLMMSFCELADEWKTCATRGSDLNRWDSQTHFCIPSGLI